METEEGEFQWRANTIYVSLERVMWIIHGDRSAPFNRLLREVAGVVR